MKRMVDGDKSPKRRLFTLNHYFILKKPDKWDIKDHHLSVAIKLKQYQNNMEIFILSPKERIIYINLKKITEP